jgi:hypothetical protein
LNIGALITGGVPEATEENENANDLVQSHEFELQYSFTIGSSCN